MAMTISLHSPIAFACMHACNPLLTCIYLMFRLSWRPRQLVKTWMQNCEISSHSRCCALAAAANAEALLCTQNVALYRCMIVLC